MIELGDPGSLIAAEARPEGGRSGAREGRLSAEPEESSELAASRPDVGRGRAPAAPQRRPAQRGDRRRGWRAPSARLLGPRRQDDQRDLQLRGPAASIVSSVWLIVPRPGEAAIATGRPRWRARSRTRYRRRADEQPADALRRPEVGVPRPPGAPPRQQPSRSISSPARSAARCGETAGRSDTARSRRRSAMPARARSSSWSGRRRRVVQAGDRRLEHRDPRPRGGRGAGDRAATTVLPTSVPVPVTKSPARRSRAGRGADSAAGTAGVEPQLARPARGDRSTSRRPRGDGVDGGCDRPRRPAQLARARGWPSPSAAAARCPRHGRRADRLCEDAALERPLAERHRAVARRRPITGTIWVRDAADVEALAR